MTSSGPSRDERERRRWRIAVSLAVAVVLLAAVTVAAVLVNAQIAAAPAGGAPGTALPPSVSAPTSAPPGRAATTTTSPARRSTSTTRGDGTEPSGGDVRGSTDSRSPTAGNPYGCRPGAATADDPCAWHWARGKTPDDVPASEVEIEGGGTAAQRWQACRDGYRKFC